MLRPVQLVKYQMNVLGPYEFHLDQNVLSALKAIAGCMGFRYWEDATFFWLWPTELVMPTKREKLTDPPLSQQ